MNENISFEEKVAQIKAKYTGQMDSNKSMDIEQMIEQFEENEK